MLLLACALLGCIAHSGGAMVIPPEAQKNNFWTNTGKVPQDLTIPQATSVDKAAARKCLFDAFSSGAERREYGVFSQV